MNKFFLILSLCVISACAEPAPKTPTLDDEIAVLNTAEKLADYYTDIYKADQSVRGENTTKVIIAHGHSSQEYKDYVAKQERTDSLNLLKIEKLYAAYGYPKKAELGELAAAAPWAVIHHASYEGRVRNWHIIKDGYKNEEIDATAMSFYLDRTYRMENKGERLRLEGTFKPETQIDSLVKLLGWEM